MKINSILKLKWLPILCMMVTELMIVSCEDDTEPAKVDWEITTNVETIVFDMKSDEAKTATVTASTTKDGVAFTETYWFKSSNPLIASVDSLSGVVTGHAEGRASIIATGVTSGTNASVLVDITGVKLTDFTEQYLLDGSVKFNWSTDDGVEVKDVQVYSGDGSLLYHEGEGLDYIIDANLAGGTFTLSKAGTDNFAAGVELNVAMTIDDEGDRIIKLVTLASSASSSVTIRDATIQWDKKSPESGIKPASAKVYSRLGSGSDDDPYTKGEPASEATVGAVQGDSLILIETLKSNTGYWFEILDANGTVLAAINNKLPTPITGIKAGQSESVWFGNAAADRNNKAECRRIADRISIGGGISETDIQSVRVRSSAGDVVAELASWNQSLTNYEYAWVNTETPIQFPTIDEALKPSALYTHNKIEPEDDAYGEFKHISFFDIPYSEESYTVELTDKDGVVYTRDYNTSKKSETANRSQVRADDIIYQNTADINATNLVWLVNSNIPGDNGSWDFTSSDPAVASIDNTGKITFIADGISVMTALAPSGQEQSFEVAAAQTYCNNYKNFNGIKAGETKGMSFWSPNGYKFDSATSDNVSVATVDGDDITAVAEGTAIITITDNQGNTAKMTVTVEPAE